MFPGLRPGLSSQAPWGPRSENLRRMATTLLPKSPKTSEVFGEALRTGPDAAGDFVQTGFHPESQVNQLREGEPERGTGREHEDG